MIETILKDTAEYNYNLGIIEGEKKERKRILKIINELECKSKLHKKDPCKEHSKIIDVEELFKEIEKTEGKK